VGLALCIRGTCGKGTLRMYPPLRVPTVSVCVCVCVNEFLCLTFYVQWTKTYVEHIFAPKTYVCQTYFVLIFYVQWMPLMDAINGRIYVPKTYVDINRHIYIPKTYVRH
jgi:hypothetical protein